MAIIKTAPKSRIIKKGLKTKGVIYNTLIDADLSARAEKYCFEKKFDSVQQVIRIVLNDFLNKNGY